MYGIVYVGFHTFMGIYMEHVWHMYEICIYICAYLEDVTNDHLGLVEYKSLVID